MGLLVVLGIPPASAASAAFLPACGLGRLVLGHLAELLTEPGDGPEEPARREMAATPPLCGLFYGRDGNSDQPSVWSVIVACQRSSSHSGPAGKSSAGWSSPWACHACSISLHRSLVVHANDSTRYWSRRVPTHPPSSVVGFGFLSTRKGLPVSRCQP